MKATSSSCQAACIARALSAHRSIRRGPQANPKRASARFSSAQVVCLTAEREEVVAGSQTTVQSTATCTIGFRVFLPVSFGDHVRVVGSLEQLGGWEVERAPALEWSEGHVWTASLELPVGAEFEYKFVHVVPNRAPVWECTSNRSLVLTASSPQAVSVTTQFNNLMAEFEARAITVQAKEALELLDTEFYSGSPAAPGEDGVPATELGTIMTAAQFQEAADYDADVESMVSIDLSDSMEDVAAMLKARRMAAAVEVVEPEVLPADDGVSSLLETPGADTTSLAVAPAEETPANNGNKLLKTVGKTAGYMAMGVAATALMSALAVDVTEVAIMGAVMAAAGGAALSGPSKGSKGEPSSSSDAAEGIDEQEPKEVRRRRPNASEPGVFFAAAVLTALDIGKSALSSASEEVADAEEQEK